MSGRVYRRCTCRDEAGKELGARCPELATNGKHGKWGFAVDLPSADKKRKTMRRHRWTTKKPAEAALRDVQSRNGQGVDVDDRELVADWLRTFLHEKRHTLKPKTLHQYRLYVDQDLIPALGAIRLEHLRHTHVSALISDMEAAGRGAPTIRRCIAVLSSALSYAVARRRLTHNVAKHAPLPPEGREERRPWSAEEAVAFLEHVTDHRLSALWEVLIGCGLRRGEALGLRWSDVDIAGRTLHVRQTLSDINGHLVFGTPKTRGSAAGVGLSTRVVEALRKYREQQLIERAVWGDAYEDNGLVFTRENGAPLRPESVLIEFHRLTDAAGLRRVRLHDLRHLAATLMISAGVPLALVSKTLRHSKMSITAELYGHLTTEAAHAASDALAGVLDAAEAERVGERKMRHATAMRPQEVDASPFSHDLKEESAGQTADSPANGEADPLELLQTKDVRPGRPESDPRRSGR